jgi:hypothetical protein
VVIEGAFSADVITDFPTGGRFKRSVFFTVRGKMDVIVVTVPASYVRGCLVAVGIAGILLGIFSAFWPGRSIGFYVWIMSKINWRVSPVDESREVSTTRRFGVVMVVLCLAMLWVLKMGKS